jgi:hypothetical protein
MFNRQQGVMIPKGQLNADLPNGPPNTVAFVAPCQMMAVQYYDETGKGHRDVLLKAGDVWYKPPQSEEWAAALRNLADWLIAGINQKIAEYEAKDVIPAQDAVDVVATDMAAQPVEVPPTNVDV